MAVASASGMVTSAVMKQVATMASAPLRSASSFWCGWRHTRTSPCRSSITSATALTAMAQVRSPVAGLVVYDRRLGDRVRKGDLVATVIGPLGDETVRLRAWIDPRLR